MSNVTDVTMSTYVRTVVACDYFQPITCWNNLKFIISTYLLNFLQMLWNCILQETHDTWLNLKMMGEKPEHLRRHLFLCRDGKLKNTKTWPTKLIYKSPTHSITWKITFQSNSKHMFESNRPTAISKWLISWLITSIINNRHLRLVVYPRQWYANESSNDPGNFHVNNWFAVDTKH